jgi:DNA-binding transcriptional MerR regulator
MTSRLRALSGAAWQSGAAAAARPDPRLRPAPDPEQRLTTIGDISREFEVTLRALRFYEDKGLLHPLRQGSTRLYRAEDKRRLTLILTGKKLGFTLTQIRELLESSASLEDPETKSPEFERALTPDQVSAQLTALERQREEIDAAISKLRTVHRTMAEALA